MSASRFRPRHGTALTAHVTGCATTALSRAHTDIARSVPEHSAFPFPEVVENFHSMILGEGAIKADGEAVGNGGP